MNWPTKALRRWSACLLSVPVLLLTTGCEDPNSITVELPGSATTTTEYRDLPATAYTVRRDSLPTLNATQMLVGRVRDNNTGIVTTARAYTNLQVSSDSLPAVFPGATLDSVVLSLAYDRVYGSTAQEGRFDVFPLRSKLDERTAYNSNVSVPVGSAILNNRVVSYSRKRKERQRVNASSTTDTTTTVALLPDPTLYFSIPNTNSFSTGLFAVLRNTSFTQNLLDTYVAGLAIAPAEDYTAAVASVNPLYSLLTVYFRDPAKPTRRHIYRLAISLNNDARYFTQLIPDVSAAGPLAVVANKQQSVPAAATNGVTYIQDGVGLATKLVIPGLEELRKQSGVTINRAELLVPVKPFSNSIFPYPGYQSLNNATKSTSINKTYLYEANNENNRVLRRTILANPVNRLVQADGSNPQGQSLDRTGLGSQAEGTLYSVDASTFYYSILMTSYTQAYLLNQLGGELPSAFLFSPTLSLPKAYQPTVNLSLNRAVLDANNIKLRVYFSNRQ